MYFHPHFSDDSDQNAATTCKHTKKTFTGCMRKFFIKEGIIYYTKDRRDKKFRCTN